MPLGWLLPKRPTAAASSLSPAEVDLAPVRGLHESDHHSCSATPRRTLAKVREQKMVIAMIRASVGITAGRPTSGTPRQPRRLQPVDGCDTKGTSMNQVLIDYGEVLSRPLAAEAMSGLAHQLGMSLPEFRQRYWEHRAPYDRGQPDREYWQTVARRDLDEATIATLVRIDVNGWLHLDPGALAWLSDLVSAGLRPWLLSNAPHPLADAVQLLPIAPFFEGMLFSCRIGQAKPSPDCFVAALQAMGATPESVTFIDDRQANIDAAAGLGMYARLFSGEYPRPEQLLPAHRPASHSRPSDRAHE